MIVIIAGTNREGALSRRLAQTLADLYHEVGIETRLLDLAQLPPEVISPTIYKAKPESFVKAFVDPILKADGLHLVVPEYNGSFPGILKLFIDLLPFPEAFERRPTAYTGLAAGTNGALRAVEQLQMVFGYRNAFNYPERVFIANSYGKWKEDGTFRDPELRNRLRRQVIGFNAFVEALSPVR